MTYSQINQPKGWGFSCRTPNLNVSLCEGRLKPKPLRGVPLNENPSTIFTSQEFGDVKWFKNLNISIQRNTSLMSRLLLSGKDFTANTTSIITLSGYQNTESKYYKARWQKC